MRTALIALTAACVGAALAGLVIAAAHDELDRFEEATHA